MFYRRSIAALIVAGCVVSCGVLTAVGYAADPPRATKSVRALSRSLQEYEQRETARREAALKAFQDVFDKAQSMDVRARLERAATVTGELAALAEKASEEDLARAGYISTSRAAIYPRTSHLAKLLAERPWIRDVMGDDHTSFQLRVNTADLRWPTEKDLPELRRLVHDRDPDVQAMAVEALATLHDPNDVPLIGGLLNVDTPTVSVFVTQHRMLALAQIGSHRFHQDEDSLAVEVFWKSGTVAEYAQRALRQMTGADLTGETFHPWLAKHGADRNSLWYWQQRLQREFDRLDLSLIRLAQEDHEAWGRQRDARQAELRKSLRAEVARLDPQVEAKVLLLTNHRHAGGADITEPQQRFFDPPWQTRLTKEELFKLLEGEQPWSDVESDDPQRGYATQIATRIMLNAERTFSREDVPRLQRLLDESKDNLWWSGRAAWIIGISRLLPAANADQLDDPVLRDGYLRRAITDERDLFTRGYVARELVRVGLPNNAPFLRDAFFSEKDSSGIPDMRGSILEALGRPPLTDEMRKFLLELIADKRCRPILTRPSLRMGDDMHRHYAARSINAHAGRELVSLMDLQDLRDQKKTSEVLDRILDSVKKLGVDRSKEGAAAP